MITLAWIKERVNVDPQTGCWLWTGTKDKDGYGIGKSQGERFRVVRKVIELTTGQMDKDHYALHCCDNPPCCNPDHLHSGTPKENTADMQKKGRAATGDRHGSKTHPDRLPTGNRNGAHTHPRGALSRRKERRTQVDRRSGCCDSQGLCRGAHGYRACRATWRLQAFDF